MSLIPDKKVSIIVKPFIYGSIAVNIGKKAKESATHKWCVYVRGLNKENISNFVKSVQFTLHPSFQNNIRTINKFPFELYEVGWGEFDIKIKIELIDENVKPIELIHSLKLYPTHQAQSSKKPVINEKYDEIIFVNPRQDILEKLLSSPTQNNLRNNMIIENEQKENQNNEMEIEESNVNVIERESKPLIDNIEQYFTNNAADDTNALKEIEEKNKYLIEEIEKIKEEIKKKENDINKVNQDILNVA